MSPPPTSLFVSLVSTSFSGDSFPSDASNSSPTLISFFSLFSFPGESLRVVFFFDGGQAAVAATRASAKLAISFLPTVIVLKGAAVEVNPCNGDIAGAGKRPEVSPSRAPTI
ncbi:unnamed protein product [Linum trigynum]|uniref:Secreted protein n=1 Tax=Linum trigynum TaxID=586398 RepID=A0AAV2DAP2_9ROSI